MPPRDLLELVAWGQIRVRYRQTFRELAREQRVQELLPPVTLYLEKVLSHYGNDRLVVDELKDLVPEAPGLGDSAPPVKSSHSNSRR